MPDLRSGTHGFHHTIDSAIEVLQRLGVADDQITIKMGGAAREPLLILDQRPRAGELLDPSVEILLIVSGWGTFHALPSGMWVAQDESQLGLQRLCGLFDDPLQKVAAWLRAGSPLFDIRPDNLPACERWAALFGVSLDKWPLAKWYALSLLLPRLHRLAGTEEGIAQALAVLLDLPARVSFEPDPNDIPLSERSLLGDRYTRLGIDYILGYRSERLAKLVIEIGPVSLAVYRSFQRSDNERVLHETLDLVAPCTQVISVRWLVLDPSKGIHLGCAELNSLLGLNTYMGAH